MNLIWKDNQGNEKTGRIPAHVAPLVQAFGIHEASEFIMKCGGTFLTLPNKPRGRNAVAKLYGEDRARVLFTALRDAGYFGSYTIPVAKRFLACYFRSQGMTLADIGVRLSATRASVRKWLLSDDEFAAKLQEDKEHRLDAVINEAVELGLVVRVGGEKPEARS
jgi:hypothetical protein